MLSYYIWYYISCTYILYIDYLLFIYLFLTAIVLTPGGSSTVHIVLTPGGSSPVHIYTQTAHRIQRTEHT
jgi:hypothetical protein